MALVRLANPIFDRQFFCIKIDPVLQSRTVNEVAVYVGIDIVFESPRIYLAFSLNGFFLATGFKD